MLTYLVRRIAIIIPTLFFVSIIIFGLQQLLPGDPALALAGEERDPNVIAFLRHKYHLDEPLPVRYGLWAMGVLRGDLGESIRINKPVLDLVLEKLPVTAESTPAGMPITQAMMIAMVASWSVTGSFSRTRSRTGTLMRIERPRSPCTTPLIQ